MKLKTAGSVLATVVGMAALYTAALAIHVELLIMEAPEVAYEASGFLNTGDGSPMTEPERRQVDEQLDCYQKSFTASDRWTHCGPHEPSELSVIHAASYLSRYVAAPLILLRQAEGLAAIIDYIQEKSLAKMESQQYSARQPLGK